MSLLHDPKNPRHQRLFDLMRQPSCARTLSGALKKGRIVELDDQLATQLQKRAAASLKKGDLVRKG